VTPPDPAPTPVRVAIVDDYELVIAGVREMLLPFSDRVVATEWASRTMPEGDVDVLLCDMFGYVDSEGVDLATLAAGPGKLVAYSWSTDPRAVARAREQGAVACLSKGLPAEALVTAIEDIHAGRPVPDPAPGPPGRGAFAELTARELAGLSPREAEVLAMIAKGLSNEEIGAQLYLSINSIKTYIRTAYRKIGVTRRSQAVAWALRHRLTPATDRGRFDDSARG